MRAATSPNELELEARDLARLHGKDAARVVNEMIAKALDEQRFVESARLWSIWRLLTGD